MTRIAIDARAATGTEARTPRLVGAGAMPRVSHTLPPFICASIDEVGRSHATPTPDPDPRASDYRPARRLRLSEVALYTTPRGLPPPAV